MATNAVVINAGIPRGSAFAYVFNLQLVVTRSVLLSPERQLRLTRFKVDL